MAAKMARIGNKTGPGALRVQLIRSLVEVTLNDGTVLSSEASTSRGTPDRPMTSDEVAEEFQDCRLHLLSSPILERVLDLIFHLENLNLENLPDVKSLTSLLR